MPKRPPRDPSPASRVISLRVLPVLLERIDTVAAALGVLRPDAIRDALVGYCERKEKTLARRAARGVVHQLWSTARGGRDCPVTRCDAWDGRVWKRDEGPLTPSVDRVTCAACLEIIDRTRG